MNNKNGEWKTINGAHIFIEEGKTINDYFKDDSKENNLKEKQLDIILKTNPMTDDYHVGIRTVEDIKTPEEAFKTKIDEDEDYVYPDFTQKDGENALKTGKIVVYSSKPFEQGGFVTPSKMMAHDYAGNKDVFSKEIDVDDVAWINSSEGQLTKI